MIFAPVGMTTHDLSPTRDPYFGLLSWWCATCGRHFLGPEDHAKQLEAVSS